MDSRTIDQQKSEKIAKRVFGQLKQAVIERDIDLWLQTLYSESHDNVASQLQRLWFEGYLLQLSPCATNIELIHYEAHQENVRAMIKFLFEYETHDPLYETYIYDIAFISTMQQWQIVSLTKAPAPFPRPIARQQVPISFDRSPLQDQPWWKRESDLELVRTSHDPLPINTYAKAIARTVRYREEYPEIECASVLSNMMSASVAKIASQLTGASLLHIFAHMYEIVQTYFDVNPTNAERGNAWQSKLNVPWFGFDEISAFGRQQGRFVGSCPSMMSLYMAVLRLAGFGPDQVLQLRLHNHDVLIVKINTDVFLFAPDKVVPLSERTPYYSRRLYRVFTDSWYWTHFGTTNLEPASIGSFLSPLNKAHTFFTTSITSSLNFSSSLPFEEGWQRESVLSSLDLHRHVVSHVLYTSQRYPQSPFTWAKYAYQTILVPMPQVYAAWSLQNTIIRSYLQKYNSEDEIIKDLRTFGKASIFLEQERIMTADQVLRHRTGDPYAHALLLWAILKILHNTSSCVLLTDQGAYCLQYQQKHWRIWDASNLSLVEHPAGYPLLIFDDRNSICPLAQSAIGSGNYPSWYTIALQFENLIHSR